MKKLYHLTDEDFRIYDHLGRDGEVVTRKVGRIPLLKWPNGRWCWEANAYLSRLLEEGRSTRNRGGTLLTYAGHISHLLRYCHGFGKSTPFIELTDDQFTAFIRTLSPPLESGKGVPPERKERHVKVVGQTCLRFLTYVGELHGRSNFVAPDGQIRIIRKNRTRRGDDDERWGTWMQSVSHASFPSGKSIPSRSPISDADIQLLRNAVPRLSPSPFLRRRRLVMLDLLAETAGRRTEVALLLVDHVLEAAKMEHPRLRILTVKRKGGRDDYRYIPISRAVLKQVTDYITFSRGPLIKRTCGKRFDDGQLFVSEKTGEGLSPETISLEISLLRREAKIPRQACAHMFRHATITNLIVELILEHEISTQDDLRKALLDVESMLEELRDFVGHLSKKAIHGYIHLAMHEVAKRHSKIRDVWKKRSFRDAHDQFQNWSRERTKADLTKEDAIWLKSLMEGMFKDSE